jgi:Holliday junction DNA helicase RuvA
MLGYLRGQVLSRVSEGDGKLIIGIGGGVGAEATGMVGYSVNVPKSAQYDLLPHGKVIELFIYTHVREDQLELFGFASRSEKELFLTLLSVNGIGPKGALSILSGCDPSTLIQAVIEGDKQFLTKTPGIGKKTAERVVLELAEPLKKKIEAGGFADFRTNALSQSQSSGGAGKGSRVSGAMGAGHSAIRDARDALVGLGYRESDISSLLNKVFAEFETPPKTEELIKTALRQLA